MPAVGFEPTIPASARPQTYALDCTAPGIGISNIIERISISSDTVCGILLKFVCIRQFCLKSGNSNKELTWRLCVFFCTHCSVICWTLVAGTSVCSRMLQSVPSTLICALSWPVLGRTLPVPHNFLSYASCFRNKRKGTKAPHLFK
jgi:hypothetical protein